MNIRAGAFVLLVGAAGSVVAMQAQGAKPFPGSVTTPTAPSPQVVPAGAASLPIYPTAKFLEIIDAGKSQQFHLYGTDAPFAEIVAYYKTTLKNGGRVLFQTPPMHQFDLGRFDEEKMAYPPSVVIKDYTWNGGEGYPHVVGATLIRYKTIIQIVPAAAR